MPILGHEQPVLYSMDEIFNPTTANMVLNAQQNYVNAMREDYKEGVQEMKNFMKEYGDFTSPYSQDVDDYYDLTTGGASKLYDSLQAQGIDPIRSKEGRAILERYIMTRPYQDLAKLKETAEHRKNYLKAAADLDRKGLLDRDYEKWRLGQLGITDDTDWSTLRGGKIWTEDSPGTLESMDDLVTPYFKGMENIDRDKGVKDGYRRSGIDDADVQQVAKPAAANIKNTLSGKYHYWKLKDDIAKANPQLSADDVTKLADEQFEKTVAGIGGERVKHMNVKPDEYALDRARSANDVWAHKQNLINDGLYGNSSIDNGYDVFTDSATWGTAQYIPGKAYDSRISAVDGKNATRATSGDLGVWKFPDPNELNNSFYTVRSVSDNKHKLENIHLPAEAKRNRETLVFTEGGHMYTRNGRSYITGTIGYKVPELDETGQQALDADGNKKFKTKFVHNKDGNRVFALEVSPDRKKRYKK